MAEPHYSVLKLNRVLIAHVNKKSGRKQAKDVIAIQRSHHGVKFLAISFSVSLTGDVMQLQVSLLLSRQKGGSNKEEGSGAYSRTAHFLQNLKESPDSMPFVKTMSHNPIAKGFWEIESFSCHIAA